MTKNDQPPISSAKLPHRGHGKMGQPVKMTPVPDAMKVSSDSEKAKIVFDPQMFSGTMTRASKSRRAKEVVEATQLTRPQKKRTEPIFEAGQKVIQSGIYEVFHGRHDVDIVSFRHLAVCISGHIFPSCKICGDSPTFRLHQRVPFIEHMDLFKDTSAPKSMP
jgi:hypothetical protein